MCYGHLSPKQRTRWRAFFSDLFRAVASFFSGVAAFAAALVYEALKRAAAAAAAFFNPKEDKIVAVAVVAGLCLAWWFVPVAAGPMMPALGAGGLFNYYYRSSHKIVKINSFVFDMISFSN